MTVMNNQELKVHKGHKIVCLVYSYGTLDEESTIECETCYKILYSEFKYCPGCEKEMNKFGECPDKCDEVYEGPEIGGYDPELDEG
jgi:hypothetical protein